MCKRNLKCLASSAPKRWPGPQNVEMGHMTLTTPTWGIVSHYKANRLASVVSYVQNLKSLAVVAVADTSGGGVKF